MLTFVKLNLDCYITSQFYDNPIHTYAYMYSVEPLYSLMWDFLLSQINIWTTTTWSNVWVVLPKSSWYEFLIGFLIWTPASKYLHLTTFSNVCVIYPCSYICNCLKMPEKSQIIEYSDQMCIVWMLSTCHSLLAG
jgi:hypothetical protein